MQNIIMINAESWDGRALGCQKHFPALKGLTPNIDRLAETGTRFSDAYCTNPICCPSRANMLSGTYTHECESWNNFKGLETGMWTIDTGLKSTHDVLLLGKHDDYLTGHHSVMNRIADMLEPLNERQLPVMNEDPAQYFNVADSDEPRCTERDWRIFEEAAAYLRGRAGAKERSLFFISINPGLVHSPFLTNQYWFKRVPEELVNIPPEDRTDHPFDLYQRNSKGWRYGFDEETVRTVRRIYFAMIAEADHLIGRLMEALDDSGLRENTTVIFTGDHGEMAMEHQQYYKMSLLEASARVPLILNGPRITPGQVVETPVSLIDLAPTVCELAEIPLRPSFSGESLLGIASGTSTDLRGYAHAMYSGVTTNTLSYMIRRGTYKLIAYDGYDSRLFDVKADPDELNDLARVHPEVVSELETLLARIVDRKETHRIWSDYRRHTFAQFQRQAKRGLYHDESYGLRDSPSSDYAALVANAFTGWGAEDEARVCAWLAAITHE